MMNLKQKLFEQNRLRFVLSFIGVAIKTALTVWIAFLLMDFTDIAISGSYEDLQYMMLKFAVFLGLYMVNDTFSFYFKNRFIEHGIRQYKQEVFQRILKKHIASFQKETTSTYISALTNDVNSIELNYMEGILNIAAQGLLFIGGLITMAYLNLIMTAAVIVTCLIPLLISIGFGNALTQAEQKTSLHNSGFTGLVKDLLSGFTVIKNFQSEKAFANNFDKQNTELEKRKRKKRDLIAIVTIFAEAGGILVNLAIFALGAYLAIQGEITAGTLIAFVQLSNYVIAPLQILPTLISNVRASKTLIQKMEAACKIEDIEGVAKKAFNEVISLHDVSFQYDENVPILNHINLRFEKGKRYAIVGGSGSGKSTLLQILLGYHTFSGDITYDDLSLKAMSKDDLYELCAIIQQNVFLFDDTIQHNVTMLKEFDEQQLMHAIHMAGLTQLWTAKGKDYACGENGCHLSGGEKQRISIARSLLKKTPVLLMDEATAALDPMTAKAVEESILSIPELTSIIVTHKLQQDVLTRYDELIVLGNHQVLEKGSYHELYEKKGYFYSLCQVQL